MAGSGGCWGNVCQWRSEGKESHSLSGEETEGSRGELWAEMMSGNEYIEGSRISSEYHWLREGRGS